MSKTNNNNKSLSQKDIDYDIFLNKYIKTYISEENIGNLVKIQHTKIEELSIFLRNIKTILDERVDYLNINGNLNGKGNITEDEISNILYKDLPNTNTKINGLLYDYCSIDDINDKNHLLYLILEVLTIENIIEEEYLIEYFKLDILNLFIIINKLIKCPILNNLINNTLSSENKELHYYKDRDLYIVGSENGVLQLSNSNDTFLKIGYSSEFEHGDIFLSFNDDNLLKYKFSLDELKNYGSKLLDIIFKNNISRQSSNTPKENNKETILKIINKEIYNIEEGNNYTRSFGMGNIEDIYSEKNIKTIIRYIDNNFTNKFIFNIYISNDNITYKLIIENLQKELNILN